MDMEYNFAQAFDEASQEISEGSEITESSEGPIDSLSDSHDQSPYDEHTADRAREHELSYTYTSSYDHDQVRIDHVNEFPGLVRQTYGHLNRDHSRERYYER